jgi:hypothetical protein
MSENSRRSSEKMAKMVKVLQSRGTAKSGRDPQVDDLEEITWKEAPIYLFATFSISNFS